METRSEILGLLTDLIEDEVSLEQTDAGLEAIARLAELPATNDEDALLDELLADIIDSFNDKRHRLRRAAEQKILERNQSQKEAVIEELRELIQTEENIGKAFNSFKDINLRWQDIGDVPRSQISRIQGEYGRLRETFFYNIQIYKELAEHDKKRNLVAKKDIIKKIVLLSEESSIKKVDTQLKAYMKQWDSIGPTNQKDWEEIRDDYWSNVKTALNRVNSYYEGIREAQSAKLQEKKALIGELQTIIDRNTEGQKAWKKATDEVLQIQERWKKVGFSQNNESIWSEFRGKCDEFFNNRRSFYGEMNEVYDDRKKKKEALIARAAELKTGTNFKQTSQALQDLQREWKTIGAASHRDENKLWQKFRGHCDEFFNKKTEFFKSKEKEEKENLSLKKELISRVEQFTLSGNKGADLGMLSAFGEEWRAIGMVPFKDKDKVNKAYFGAIGVHYDKLKLDEKERRDIQMKNRMAKLKDDPKAIKDEKFQVRRKIDRLNKEIQQYENNLGFFNPHQANPFRDEVEKKIKRNKSQIAELKTVLKALDQV